MDLIEDHSQIFQHQFPYFFKEFNYDSKLKLIFSIRLFQILFSELIKTNSKDKKKQTYFDKTWLEHEDFSCWVAEVKNEPTKYRCKTCHKTNGLSNMGIDALKIHSKVLMKLMQIKLRIFLGAQRHQQVLIH